MTPRRSKILRTLVLSSIDLESLNDSKTNSKIRYGITTLQFEVKDWIKCILSGEINIGKPCLGTLDKCLNLSLLVPQKAFKIRPRSSKDKNGL